MRSATIGLGHIRRVAALGFILAAAGCQSTDTFGLLNLGRDEERKPTISQAELRAFCPRVHLREGTAYFNTYTRDGQNDPSKIIYQASISDVTRSCSFGPGTMTLTVAAAGRVVPGPAGQAGTIRMPIRVAVVQGGEVIYSQLHEYQVVVNAGTGATQFVFTDPNVTIPAPTGTNIQVFTGFDEGAEQPQRRPRG